MPRSLRALLATALVVTCTAVSPAALAAPPAPDARFEALAGDRVRARLSAPVDADGFNVYRDGRYVTTARPARGATSVEFAGSAGTYCLVAFADEGGATRYSRCGPSRDTETASAADDAARSLQPRALRYGTRNGELQWTPSAAARYEIRRAGSVVATRDGRSHYTDALPSPAAHDFEIVPLYRDGRRGATVPIRMPAFGATGRTGAVSDGGAVSIPRTTLSEGGDWRRLEIAITRTAADRDRTLRPSLHEDVPAALRRLDHRFEPATLAPGASRVGLMLRLNVDVAPILPGERRLRLRLDGGERRREAAFSVGVQPIARDDVYLLIGQSNMEGYSRAGTRRAGDGESDRPESRIRQLNVMPNSRSVFPDAASFRRESANVAEPRYIVAEDPLHEPRGAAASRKGGDRIGLGLSFAKSALARTTRRIFLVPAAWSGTGFCDNVFGGIGWNAWPSDAPELGDTLLTERALLRLNTTLRDTGGILRGILWHQGGADANDRRCYERHAEHLQQLVRRLRSEATVDARGPSARGGDADVPFLVATQSRGRDERGDFSRWNEGRIRIDAVHRDIRSLVPHSAFVNNDDLVPPAYPCGEGSCVHFGADALREQGRRFDAALGRVIRDAGQPVP